MENIVDQLSGIIPPKYLSLLTAAFLASQVLGRIYQSIVSGGGLRSIIRGIWLGTNAATPKQDTAPDITIPKLPLLLLLGALCVSAVTLQGCATTPQTKEAITFNTFRDTWTVAHSAYRAHCERVVQGKVSKLNELKVDAAWNRFRLVFKVAFSAANQDWTQLPPASLDVAEKELLNLIRNL